MRAEPNSGKRQAGRPFRDVSQNRVTGFVGKIAAICHG